MNKLPLWMTLGLLAAPLLLSGCQNLNSADVKEINRTSSTKKYSSPNVLIILADDMGYSDLGVYGGEIRTPYLDQLAQESFQFTNFYSGAYCSPSRAMLMTGRDSHSAGIGMMAEINGYYLRNGLHPFEDGLDPENIPINFQGYISKQLPMLPEKFKDYGYTTLHSGKWHLSSEMLPIKGDNKRFRIGFRDGTLPLERGFDRSFALLNGAAAHFKSDREKPTRYDNGIYNDNGKKLSQSDLPENFYSTEYFTDRLISDLKISHDASKPFFAYLALTAPHWPLQVPDKYLDIYSGLYDKGYEEVRKDRLLRLKSMGIIGDSFSTPLPSKSHGGTGEKTWKELTPQEKQVQARKMEIYAAMVTYMDEQIGKLIRYLKSTESYENTVIVFLSDNGPDPGKDAKDAHANDTLANMGRVRSTIGYGERWAEVSATPFKLWKGYAGSDGSVRVPAIIKIPGAVPQRIDQLFHITDLMPTLLDIASNNQKTDSGKSPKLVNKYDAANRVIAGELGGHAYVLHNGWKLSRSFDPGNTPMHHQPSDWKLYDLQKDPGESKDLAGLYPERVDELKAHWAAYQKTNGLSDSTAVLRIPRDMDKN